jgi:hypothetical protein
MIDEFENAASAKKTLESFEPEDKINRRAPEIKCRYCPNKFSACTYVMTVEIYKRHLTKRHSIFD